MPRTCGCALSTAPRRNKPSTLCSPHERRRAEVALRVGITLGPYNRIEQGHAATRINTLTLIADAIGVPLADLVRE
ncbi:helix-turn-helix domain-containing protein [Streptomyces sp. NPDC058240]|uniref:helix-turn-helix domain-containing protein n=1 Tax=Streptomyces sp. NPDC058240 TaxID=3346396 RepID=UPI0036E9ACD2